MNDGGPPLAPRLENSLVYDSLRAALLRRERRPFGRTAEIDPADDADDGAETEAPAR